MKTLAIDIETYSSVDLTKSGVYKYVQSDDFEILLFAYSLDNAPVEVIDIAAGEIIPTAVALALTDPSVLKTAHNANFERTCIAQFFELTLPPSQWECTMIKVSMLGFPLGLDQASKALKLPESKSPVGKSLIRYFSLPCKPTKVNGGRTRNLPEHAPEKWAEFKAYCAQDVVVEQAIRQRISFFQIPASEKKLWELDQEINDRGIPIDPEFVKNAIRMDLTNKEKLTAEAIELTGLDNPNSAAQLKAWLSEETGDEVTKLTVGSIPDLLQTIDCDKVKRVLQLRQEMSKTSVKKYVSMLHGVCPDNRVRGLLQFNGANRTGRWAGRLIQVQNLPKNQLEDLDLARELVKEGNLSMLELLFGNVPDTLSQLIRTAFVAPDGHRFIVADFSAIEARVIAWLSGERWRLEVFNTHGKIYEASASHMFKVPLEEVTKGSVLRQKGKMCELALGYQGGPDAITKIEISNKTPKEKRIPEEELPKLVAMWRQANPAIKKFWYALENAALTCVMENTPVCMPHGIKFSMEKGIMFIELPSKRKLAYVRAHVRDNKFGGKSVFYEGMDQTTKQWGLQQTYGGKLAENCIAGDTLVLTENGWKQLSSISIHDRVWDGVEWVNHDGLKDSGYQDTICLDGVYCTPDHKILTNVGWENASSCQGHNRFEVTLPDSCPIYWFQREEVNLGDQMRLRINRGNARFGISERKKKVLRLPERAADHRIEKNALDVESSRVCGMEIDESPVHKSETSGMGKLWRKRNYCVSKMAGQLRRFLGGHGTRLSKRIINRQDRCEQGILSGKLLLDNRQEAKPQSKIQCVDSNSLGRNDYIRSGGEIRNRKNNNTLPVEKQLAPHRFILTSGCHQQVFDILNAGQRRRFTVLGSQGPFLVHNCVQAVARDCLADAMIRTTEAGYDISIHVHDELVFDVPNGKGSVEEINKIMGQEISWAKGLPMQADSYETKYYRKD